jgi:hypothetical protein
MARARNIKPSYFKNEELAECEPLARILYAGLWTICDRDGRLEDRPARIKAEVLPYDVCNIDALLDQLDDHNFILRYEIADQCCIQITTWSKHARPHKDEVSYGLPEIPEDFARSRKIFRPLALNASSLNASSLNAEETPLPPKGALAPQEFLTAWNAVPAFCACKGLTGKRLRSFQARARERDWVNSWRAALEKAGTSPFCRGENERGWRATADWFLRPDTVNRILEGQYDANRSRSPPAEKTESIEEKAARRVREREERNRFLGLEEPDGTA